MGRRLILGELLCPREEYQFDFGVPISFWQGYLWSREFYTLDGVLDVAWGIMGRL